MQTSAQAFDVSLTNKTVTTVKAHDATIDGGALVFFDRNGDVIKAYGPTAWFSITPVREAVAL